MSGEIRSPHHEDLVKDLRRLRERGLTAIRDLLLPGLNAAALLAGETADEQPSPKQLEELLRNAIGKLGGGDLQRAAEYTFGTHQGMRDAPAFIRRRRAAQVYGVTPERFRKAQELIVVSQIADAILGLCADRSSSRAKISNVELTTERPLGSWVRFRHQHPITLHIGPIGLLAGVDIIVSSENVYFEGSQTFKPSLSAALRLASSTRDITGAIVDDVVSRELTAWVDRNARRGLPVAAGTVVATSPGELRRQGIRRIYHAAIVRPMYGTDSYDVPSEAIPLAVRNAMQLARTERATVSPPLRSICFPLFGSGSGGLTQQESLALIWESISRELSDAWDIHLLTRNVTSMKLEDWTPLRREGEGPY